MDDAAGWIEQLNDLDEELAGGKNIESPRWAEFQSRPWGELRVTSTQKLKAGKAAG